MVCQSNSIALSILSGYSRFIRTKGNIQKVEHCLRRKKRVSIRKLSMELSISDRSVRQTMKNDLGLHSSLVDVYELQNNSETMNYKIIPKTRSSTRDYMKLAGITWDSMGYSGFHGITGCYTIDDANKL